MRRSGSRRLRRRPTSSSTHRTGLTLKSSPTRRRTWPTSRPSKRNSSAHTRDLPSGLGLTDDAKWMAEALRLAEEARGRSAPNPNVGCVIVSSSGRAVGRGATAAAGRPHAEALALEDAGKRANGATVYVTLEPCAHESPRGVACTELLLNARPARVVIALKDPDRRTSGKGIHRLRRAGIEVALGVGRAAAKLSLEGWLTLLTLGRPRITLKLALSIDGKIALRSGESKWSTG